MSLAIPYTFIGGPGNKAYASQVNANFQAVASKFTEGAGGISDGDISATAAIRGSKLSSVPGNRVPTDRIEDDAIDKDKLKDDATAGSPNAAVNTANHIKDGIITALKLAALCVVAGKIKIATYDYNPGGVHNPGTVLYQNTGLGSTIIPLTIETRAATAAFAQQANWDTCLLFDTTTLTYYIRVKNGGSFAISGTTFRLTYVAAS